MLFKKIYYPFLWYFYLCYDSLILCIIQMFWQLGFGIIWTFSYVLEVLDFEWRIRYTHIYTFPFSGFLSFSFFNLIQTVLYVLIWANSHRFCITFGKSRNFQLERKSSKEKKTFDLWCFTLNWGIKRNCNLNLTPSYAVELL